MLMLMATADVRSIVLCRSMMIKWQFVPECVCVCVCSAMCKIDELLNQ